MTGAAAGADGIRAHTERLLLGLRGFGADYTEITRRFAGYLGLHSTDAAALTEILFAEDSGVLMTPARLAERVSLTSGATTALINRLEAAGHVVRTREHADRRVVTLRSSRSIGRPARTFFAPLGETVDAMVAEYPEEFVRGVEEFLEHLNATVTELLAGPAMTGDPRRL